MRPRANETIVAHDEYRLVFLGSRGVNVDNALGYTEKSPWVQAVY
jgi:hypothetical protein